MSCPYDGKNLQKLPCHFVQHPQKPHLFVCCVCKNSCDAQEVDNPFGSLLGLLIGVIIVMAVIVDGRADVPNQPATETRQSLKVEPFR
ncbi:hypothetical protein [Microcoleus sp. FACHB-672]|uniref:hypothetical protein n=1 Tax=Microcoleus sp. FACHB-672 TaxID=2692825 RepID=UPI0016835257|nr:hypothetical protein [Microcoleus sp. FACHB-672]MBD2040201.1 hypothetical protein [Microcoleus sp. FACHB-672]